MCRSVVKSISLGEVRYLKNLKIEKHMLNISYLYLRRYRLNEMTGDVHIYYRKNVDHSWKTLNGSFFKQRVDGSIIMPTLHYLWCWHHLKRSISKILRRACHFGQRWCRSLYCWVKVKQIQMVIKGKGQFGTYPRFPNIIHMENNHPAVHEDLQRLLTNEDENPEVTFFL